MSHQKMCVSEVAFPHACAFGSVGIACPSSMTLLLHLTSKRLTSSATHVANCHLSYFLQACLLLMYVSARPLPNKHVSVRLWLCQAIRAVQDPPTLWDTMGEDSRRQKDQSKLDTCLGEIPDITITRITCWIFECHVFAVRLRNNSWLSLMELTVIGLAHL